MSERRRNVSAPERPFADNSVSAGVWTLGDPAAGSAIRGAAGAFCRVGAQRLAPADAGLRTDGPDAETALCLLCNYAA